jgi:CRISPR-associated endonuclease Cas2
MHFRKSLFLVAYDLRGKPEEQYQELSSKLKSLGAIHVQESVWALRSNRSALLLRRMLSGYIEKGDRLLVARIHGWSSKNGLTKIRNV